MGYILSFDVIIIGAGAAGLFCAAQASKRGKKILILDHAKQAGKKILISGGGHCNFTNRHIYPHCYLSQNPHFVKSALKRFSSEDFTQLVESYGIPYHEKKLGQLFCDGSAKEILAMLLRECQMGQVEIRTSCAISNVDYDGLFRIETSQGHFSATSLVVATGGVSIPQMGATGFAYDLAKKFNIEVIQPSPALVPLTLPEEYGHFLSLAGLAFESIVTHEKASFHDATLFTHRGISGPAILQISSYWQRDEVIKINFLPHAPDHCLLRLKQEKPKWQLKRALHQFLPERLAQLLQAHLPDLGTLSETRDTILDEIEARVKGWIFKPNGSEGFRKAEVTLGGISTKALNSQTMATYSYPNLYFIGEAVDVTGWLGGFNFQWAWSSGFVCAEAL